MAWFLKKLGDTNPAMKIDIVDFCATFSNDQDDNGTLITPVVTQSISLATEGGATADT